jgi:hypothetical protein
LWAEMHGAGSIFVCFSFAYHSWGNLIFYILRLGMIQCHALPKIRARYICEGSPVLNRQPTKVVPFKFWTLHSLFGLNTTLEQLLRLTTLRFDNFSFTAIYVDYFEAIAIGSNFFRKSFSLNFKNS